MKMPCKSVFQEWRSHLDWPFPVGTSLLLLEFWLACKMAQQFNPNCPLTSKHVYTINPKEKMLPFWDSWVKTGCLLISGF